MSETKSAAKIIIGFVGGYAIIALVGSLVTILVLASKDKAIPTEQVAILMGVTSSGGTALGILGSMLNQTSNQHPPPQVDGIVTKVQP